MVRDHDGGLMATYIYETIPQKRGQKPRRFEYEQKMTDPPLTKDPETGLPVRRVITGQHYHAGTSILSMNRPKRR
jgi:predicted nucleic acid-binding Zn ribbon protein